MTEVVKKDFYSDGLRVLMRGDVIDSAHTMRFGWRKVPVEQVAQA